MSGRDLKNPEKNKQQLDQQADLLLLLLILKQSNVSDIPEDLKALRAAAEAAQSQSNLPFDVFAERYLKPAREELNAYSGGKSRLIPDLQRILDAEERGIKDLYKDPRTGIIRTMTERVNIAAEAARKWGIDENLFINQIYAESKFIDHRPNPWNAAGYAQFIPSTFSRYDKNSANIHNIHASLDAAAHHMSDLTKKYGDQRLALAAYNGGDGAISKTARSAGKTGITVTELLDQWREERGKYGNGSISSYRNQTFNYILKIDSTLGSGTKHWPQGKFLAGSTINDDLPFKTRSLGSIKATNVFASASKPVDHETVADATHKPKTPGPVA